MKVIVAVPVGTPVREFPSVVVARGHFWPAEPLDAMADSIELFLTGEAPAEYLKRRLMTEKAIRALVCH